ncbi:hypothetical protein P9112_014172 [Eukaryota sp. TZLM1-RC]
MTVLSLPELRHQCCNKKKSICTQDLSTAVNSLLSHLELSTRYEQALVLQVLSRCVERANLSDVSLFKPLLQQCLIYIQPGSPFSDLSAKLLHRLASPTPATLSSIEKPSIIYIFLQDDSILSEFSLKCLYNCFVFISAKSRPFLHPVIQIFGPPSKVLIFDLFSRLTSEDPHVIDGIVDLIRSFDSNLTHFYEFLTHLDLNQEFPFCLLNKVVINSSISEKSQSLLPGLVLLVSWSLNQTGNQSKLIESLNQLLPILSKMIHVSLLQPSIYSFSINQANGQIDSTNSNQNLRAQDYWRICLNLVRVIKEMGLILLKSKDFLVVDVIKSVIFDLFTCSLMTIHPTLNDSIISAVKELLNCANNLPEGHKSVILSSIFDLVKQNLVDSNATFAKRTGSFSRLIIVFFQYLQPDEVSFAVSLLSETIRNHQQSDMIDNVIKSVIVASAFLSSPAFAKNSVEILHKHDFFRSIERLLAMCSANQSFLIENSFLILTAKLRNRILSQAKLVNKSKELLSIWKLIRSDLVFELLQLFLNSSSEMVQYAGLILMSNLSFIPCNPELKTQFTQKVDFISSMCVLLMLNRNAYMRFAAVNVLYSIRGPDEALVVSLLDNIDKAESNKVHSILVYCRLLVENSHSEWFNRIATLLSQLSAVTIPLIQELIHELGGLLSEKKQSSEISLNNLDFDTSFQYFLDGTDKETFKNWFSRNCVVKKNPEESTLVSKFLTFCSNILTSDAGDPASVSFTEFLELIELLEEEVFESELVFTSLVKFCLLFCCTQSNCQVVFSFVSRLFAPVYCTFDMLEVFYLKNSSSLINVCLELFNNENNDYLSETVLFYSILKLIHKRNLKDNFASCFRINLLQAADTNNIGSLIRSKFVNVLKNIDTFSDPPSLII